MPGKNIPEKAPTAAYDEGVEAIVKRVESQSEKFKRAARELGADEGDEVALDKALRKMKRQPEKAERPKKDES